MQILPEILKPRAAWIIYHVMLQRPENRFKGWDPNKFDLRWKWINPNSIRYDVDPQDGLPYAVRDWQYIEFWNIDFKNATDLQFSELVQIGMEPQDAWELIEDNRNGVSPLDWQYEGTFGEIQTKSKRKLDALTEGIEASFRVGGDEDIVQSSITAYVEGHHEWEDTDTDEKHADRTITSSGSVPVGKRVKIYGTRDVCKMQETITGKSNFEHSIYISSIAGWVGPLICNRDWEFRWDSFQHFIDVQKGNAPGALAEDFQRNPSPADQIAFLERPLGADINKTFEYENATNARVVVEEF